MGSPPPPTSKNLVLALRSVNNIVIAPASTGSDRSRRRAVIWIDHVRRVILAGAAGIDWLLAPVVRKLMAPRIDLAPARCKEKIVKSTAAPL